jgi:FAD/FMN-containing dehydrogenase
MKTNNQNINVHEMPAVLKDESVLSDFRSKIRGRSYMKGDEGYDESRKIWNGMIDKYPAVIVKCSGTADVINTVKFARQQGIRVSVRGGGHNVSGNAICEGGIVIDLSQMRSVRVDAEKKRVRVSGGALLGDIDHETQAFGLAVPAGVMSRTGIAGLALNGGMGLLSRKYGLTSDNLLSADVVTADGKMLVANADQNSDLLWALKGGSGSFGVVTSFEFRLHPVGPDVWIALVLYPINQAEKIIRFFRDFMSTADDEIMAIALFWNAPEQDFIPEEYRGAPVVILAACYSGNAEEGENAIRPFREIETPVADLSGRMPFTTAQTLFDHDYPDGKRYYWKSTYLNSLSDEVIEALIFHAGNRPSPISSLDIWALGGALGRVKPGDTAFAQRNMPFLAGIESNWENPVDDTANMEWTRETYQDLQRFSSGAAYLNFPGFGEEGKTLLKASFGDNFDRLQQIKAKYDPENFFSSNLNIPLPLY